MVCGVIILNVLFIILESVDQFAFQYPGLIEATATAFFTFFFVEYLLRFWISDIVYQDMGHPMKSRIRYLFSTINYWFIISFPHLFGNKLIDFRVFRILRLFRITQIRILQEYSSLITRVFKMKGKQLLSSMIVVMIFMLTTSLIIYDLEYKVQPEVFKNILECLWWSMSTIPTVGYGDLYPITPLGKAFGSFVSIFRHLHHGHSNWYHQFRFFWSIEKIWWYRWKYWIKYRLSNIGERKILIIYEGGWKYESKFNI